MAKRTLKQARDALEQDVIPRVNDHQARELTAVLEQEEETARTRVRDMLDDEEQRFTQLRSEALHELTDVRDEADALYAEAQEGRLTASEYAERLDALSVRHTDAEARLAEASSKVEYIASAEDDAVAWFSELQQRIPTMRVDVPW